MVATGLALVKSIFFHDIDRIEMGRPNALRAAHFDLRHRLHLRGRCGN